jgi:hypothetical protein
MNPPIEKLREYVRQCDPREPLNGNDDARYVDLDDAREPLRGSDGSAIDQLRHTILLSTPDRPRCLLFTGYPGSGKTTELRELHRRLEAQTTDPADASGYRRLYVEHVLQADEGCDFDFLRGCRGSAVPRHSH